MYKSSEKQRAHVRKMIMQESGVGMNMGRTYVLSAGGGAFEERQMTPRQASQLNVALTKDFVRDMDKPGTTLKHWDPKNKTKNK